VTKRTDTSYIDKLIETY